MKAWTIGVETPASESDNEVEQHLSRSSASNDLDKDAGRGLKLSGHQHATRPLVIVDVDQHVPATSRFAPRMSQDPGPQGGTAPYLSHWKGGGCCAGGPFSCLGHELRIGQPVAPSKRLGSRARVAVCNGVQICESAPTAAPLPAYPFLEPDVHLAPLRERPSFKAFLTKLRRAGIPQRTDGLEAYDLRRRDKDFEIVDSKATAPPTNTPTTAQAVQISSGD
jgi:hypothetical protein